MSNEAQNPNAKEYLKHAVLLQTPRSETQMTNEFQTPAIVVKDQILRFAVVFWIPAFAGMTAGSGAQIRRAGGSRHPGFFP
jgi:hypothetical protein